ncbi:MAG TPA: DNA mismatch repair endonuclease MutL [Desulfobacteria bacterium]|nr:DNA mismatch repair endonuclease MutL [Desulfobacteria bacterium]
MGKIVLLDELTANKIAAGEVVERPASVVKELIENSIDAGSTKIDISILDGGLREIIVSDNGGGMEPDDASLAFERHATSKIRTAEDLNHIGTLGFRGEALASISAVSRLEIKTKTIDNLAGTHIVIEGGKTVATTDVGCPVGTIIRVSDLFFNTPARKKHMKSHIVEAGNISNVVSKIAMAYPGISFQLSSNNKQIFKTAGNGNVKECIAEIYGSEYARDMLHAAKSNGHQSVMGYIGKPALTRSSRTHQVIYINGRYIKDRFISEAVEKAFHSMLMTGRHPVFVLHITTGPDMVDVNVHPAKTVVRIAEQSLLHDFIFTVAKETLSNHSLISEQPAKIRKTHDESLSVQQELHMPKNVTTSGIVLLGTPEIIPEMTPEIISEIKPDKSVPTEHAAIEMNPELSPDVFTDFHPQKTPDSEPEKNPDSKPKEIEAEEIPDLPPGETDLTSDKISEAAAEYSTFPELRPIGQIDSTYIIAQGLSGGMYVLDQHAAHERVLYEKYMSRSETYISIVQLLIPETVQLTHQEAQVLIEKITVFADLGFVIEHFGATSFLIRGVPAAVAKDSVREIFLDLLDYFSHNRYTISGKMLQEKFLIMTACKNAIKANQKLVLPEMETLIEQLSAARQPYTCPHGRPTIVYFSDMELQKKFKRVL